jgi:hypothetical protein
VQALVTTVKVRMTASAGDHPQSQLTLLLLAVGRRAERPIDSLTPSSSIFHDFSAGMDPSGIRMRIDITRNYRFPNDDEETMWRVRG